MNKFNLIKNVLEHSEETQDYNIAAFEWDIVDCALVRNSVCLCGKENIKYCYTIQNFKNNNVLYPIGSSCIRKFNNDNLTNKTKIYEKNNKEFKNKGGKCDGLTYDEICKNHKDYINFLLSVNLKKKTYKDLVKYYKIVYLK